MPFIEAQSLSFSNKHSKVVCRQDFSFFEKELLDFKSWFDQDGKVIHADRNVLKSFDASRIEKANVDIVAKAFKKPHLISRIIYSFFRASKAKRSFENSWRLQEAGFSVPAPVAYIENFEQGLLKESFYISERLDFDCTLHEVYRKQMFDWQVILPLVVEQAFLMHSAGLMHRDFSHGNVLVKKQGDEFSFSFVDLNRLHVGAVSFDLGLKSFVRLANDEYSLNMIAKYYAFHTKNDESQALTVLSDYLKKHKQQKELKEKIKVKLGIKKKND